MHRPFSAVTRFVAELRRRHVFRVGAAYAVVAWLVVQVSHTVSPYLNVPPWSVTLIIVLSALGFPLALILAWAYDITPEGVQRTAAPALDPHGGARSPAGSGLPGPSGPDAPSPSTGRTEPGSGSPGTNRSDRIRLIVLPFRVLRADPEIDFLSFSLPDAVSSSLSGLRSLVVRSHLAALRYADGGDLERIGNEADVDVVLSGSLLRGGERLRVSVQLTEVRDGTLLWTQSSEVPVGDLFQLQDQLTKRIVDSLDLPLTSREREILSRDVPATPRAYEYYLRANRVAYQAGQWPLARDLYLQSIEEDPEYAPALARLARCYRLIAKWSKDEGGYRKNLEASESMFQAALEANPDLSIAHNLYAQLEVEVGRAEDAMVRLVRQAHATGGEAELYAGLVHVLRFCGLLDWSVAAHRRARSLDPRVTTSVAHTCYMLGEFEEVLDETFGDIGYIAPLALASMDREDEALCMLRESESAASGQGVKSYLTSLRALLEGREEESVDAMGYIVGTLRDPEALFYMVRQYARLGRVGEAVSLFERIVEDGFYCFPFMSSDPWLDGIRSSPRFRWSLQQAERRHSLARDAFLREGGEAVLSSGDPGSDLLGADRGSPRAV
jgi:eukaryotic-like serine/threonine-protein kinase